MMMKDVAYKSKLALGMSKGMVNFYICNAIGQNLALFWDYCKSTKSKVCQIMAMFDQLNDELLRVRSQSVL